MAWPGASPFAAAAPTAAMIAEVRTWGLAGQSEAAVAEDGPPEDSSAVRITCAPATRTNKAAADVRKTLCSDLPPFGPDQLSAWCPSMTISVRPLSIEPYR